MIRYLIFIYILGSCSALAISKNNNRISEDVQFYLYTQKDSNDSVHLEIDKPLDRNTKRSLPWKFFIHGWTTSPEKSPWFWSGKENYFTRGKYNIVFVDWSNPANQSYPLSICNALDSGRFVGKFLLSLKNQAVPLENIHLLGHSLGSHMAAIAARYVNEISGKKIGRLTGLDAAGPLFETPEFLPERCRFKISKEDADFVDGIHTDIGQYGIIESFGHVDFFPNGGHSSQPGCENNTDVNCSHAKSVEYYVESIINDKGIAWQCDSYKDFLDGFCVNNTQTAFGEDVQRNLTGDFYFNTNAEPPFWEEEAAQGL